jgi:molybdopterin molybdotransferase
MNNMITVDEALKIVLDSCVPTGLESVHFMESAGRILAEDVKSDIDMPPFNRSAVDGYACNKADLGQELEVVELVQAGKKPEKTVSKCQCSKIMTGAIVPDGCDIVFMVEDSAELPTGKVIFTGKGIKPNMSVKGEDVRTGDIVLKKNKLIEPQDIALFASVGCTEVRVARKPSIGIMSTGDELVEPYNVPEYSKIRNSNAYQLLSQAKRAGGEARYYGIAPDTEEATFEMLLKALGENDVVILTGGVSMGDFDFVPAVMKRAGVKILFNQINVQPGKPTTFGIHSKTVVFGLPGNPVSSFLQFETLVRPLIYKMMGFDWKPLVINLPMAVRFERRSADRVGRIPVFINEEMEVMPAEYHGSAHISAISFMFGIVTVQEGKKIIEKGEIVSVRQI